MSRPCTRTSSCRNRCPARSHCSPAQYTAIARHWSVADREAHENMGFHTGWGIATDQLAALAATL